MIELYPNPTFFPIFLFWAVLNNLWHNIQQSSLYCDLLLASESPREILFRLIRLETKGYEGSLRIKEIKSLGIVIDYILGTVNIEPSITHQLLLVEDGSVGTEEWKLSECSSCLGHTHVIHLTESLFIRIEPERGRKICILFSAVGDWVSKCCYVNVTQHHNLMILPSIYPSSAFKWGCWQVIEIQSWIILARNSGNGAQARWNCHKQTNLWKEERKKQSLKAQIILLTNARDLIVIFVEFTWWMETSTDSGMMRAFYWVSCTDDTHWLFSWNMRNWSTALITTIGHKTLLYARHIDSIISCN